MDMYFFDGKPKTAAAIHPWRWLKRLTALAFGCVLVAHAAYTAARFPILRHEQSIAKLKIGDTRATMIELVGEPQFSKSNPQWGTVCEYRVYPWFMSHSYQNNRFRTRWRVVLDDSDRVVFKARLNPIGC
ncbi:hypothetical protein [Anatilimnocola floriformis]|uniref:hypothetical protein n=1 Tax=Anatilimnocola floriformis TaxID=2948575 RepID=UPI0020C535D4|nr:hypothetical protein [Anatilimnocola floriformis]